MKLGIYGGSFNPVHLGHLFVAQAAVEELELDRLYFVPAARSPFKKDNEMAPAEARLRWLRLALAGKTDCELDTREIQRGGVSYTIDTLREFARQFPGAQLFYLIGADHIAKLNEWGKAVELASLAEFIAIPRPGETETDFPKPFRGRFLKGVPVGISSSQIRDRLKARQPIDHLVPPFVADAIRSSGLYR